jgi:hypothetical protein
MSCRLYKGLVFAGMVLALIADNPALAHGVKPDGVHVPLKAEAARMWLLDLLISNATAKASFRISQSDGYRYIEADGLPDHQTGQFPGPRNPHTISQQDYGFRIPLNPKKTGLAKTYSHQNFGVALNGVPFDPFTAEYWNNDRSTGWNIEAKSGLLDLGLDNSNAHVQPDGSYHYHGIPSGLLEKHLLMGKPVLLGYAADGFAIYGPFGHQNTSDPGSPLITLNPSFKIKKGQRPEGAPPGPYNGLYVQDYEFVQGSGDLDQCNGRQAVTPENPGGVYHYVLTATYPFIPRCFSGTPDRSFERQRNGPPQQTGRQPRQMQGQGQQRPRQMQGQSQRRGPPDLREAARKLGVSHEKLRRALGPPPPDFERAARELGLSIEDLRKVLPRR